MRIHRPIAASLAASAFSFLALSLSALSAAHAQDATPQQSQPWEDYERVQVALLAGMTQPLLLGGGNVQADVYYKRFSFAYSHGFNLQFTGSAVTGEAADQGLAFTMPYTTGFGVGARLLEWLDVRLEGKLHRFDVREANATQTSFSYSTITLGAGIYARYRPFYHFSAKTWAPTWMHGIVVAPSVRFWPNVWTSLEDDERLYNNTTTTKQETHTALRAGVANTALVGNIGLGYMVTF